MNDQINAFIFSMHVNLFIRKKYERVRELISFLSTERERERIQFF